MAEVRFGVLGPVEVSVDGRPLALGATKQRAVLAMLALSANSVVSADRLMEGLWGEHPPPSSAPKMVQLYVSQLRKLLSGADGAEIVTRGRGYELRVDPDAVDAVRAERLLERAVRGARGRWSCSAGRRWPTSRTSRSPRRRSADSRSCAWRRCWRRWRPSVGGRRHDAALPEIEALLAEQPLSERLHELRVLALYRAGRQADALAGVPHRADAVRGGGRRRAGSGAARAARGGPAAGPGARAAAGLPTRDADACCSPTSRGRRGCCANWATGIRRCWREHQRRLRAAAAAHGGVEVNTQGDAFFFVFAGAAEACAAAARCHAALDELADPRADRHPHRRARAASATTTRASTCIAPRGSARPGTAARRVISERTRSLLPASVAVRDLGLHRLKDLGERGEAVPARRRSVPAAALAQRDQPPRPAVAAGRPPARRRRGSPSWCGRAGS